MKSKKMLILCLSMVLLIGPARPVWANEAKGGVGLLSDGEDEEIDKFFEEEEVFDPLEPMNRVFFEVNDKIYFWVLKPVNTAYTAVLPQNVRQGVGNFFENAAAPVRVVNNLLQGKFADARTDFARFLVNSTLGFLGFGDPALQAFGLEAKPEDFGQTLGVWGVGEGPYLYLPIIGSLTIRDTVGFVGNSALHPATYVLGDFPEQAAYYSTDKVNLLSLNPGLYEDMKKYSLDPYISVRQVYLEYRRNKTLDNDVEVDLIQK